MNFLRKSTISFVVFLCLFLQIFSCMASGTEIALSTLTSKELRVQPLPKMLALRRK